MFHILLHFIVPAIVAFLFYRSLAFKAWLIMMATMAIDLDHLLANPIYDPNRCSVGFHPLHSYYAIAVYILMLIVPKFRIVAIGLIIHILLDYIDCFV